MCRGGCGWLQQEDGKLLCRRAAGQSIGARQSTDYGEISSYLELFARGWRLSKNDQGLEACMQRR